MYIILHSEGRSKTYLGEIGYVIKRFLKRSHTTLTLFRIIILLNCKYLKISIKLSNNIKLLKYYAISFISIKFDRFIKYNPSYAKSMHITAGENNIDALKMLSL